MISPHKGPVTRKRDPFDDVIMVWTPYKIKHIEQLEVVQERYLAKEKTKIGVTDHISIFRFLFVDWEKEKDT